jgi:mono/diheme cytochrome c family protein
VKGPGRKRAGLTAALLALASGTAAAQSAGQWQGPPHLWRALCGYCHGTGVAKQLLGAERPAAVIVDVVRRGLPQMPQFAPTQISDAELAGLAQWISVSEPPPPAPKEQAR